MLTAQPSPLFKSFLSSLDRFVEMCLIAGVAIIGSGFFILGLVSMNCMETPEDIHATITRLVMGGILSCGVVHWVRGFRNRTNLFDRRE